MRAFLAAGVMAGSASRAASSALGGSEGLLRVADGGVRLVLRAGLPIILVFVSMLAR